MNGARLNYEVKGEGPAVVLLHAGIADLRMWDEQVAAWSPKFKVIRYDLRGFGRSSMPEGFFSHAEDLRGLLDHLGVSRAHVVGISNGGRVAIEFAIRYPLRTAGLVLAAPALGGFEWTDAMVAYGERGDKLAEKGDLDAVVALDLATWVAGPHRKLEAVDPAVRERMREMIRGANERWADQIKGTAQWLDPPAATRLRTVKAPTLVLVGDKDMADMISIADLIEKRVAGARKVVFPGVAHMLSLERPALFNKMVAEFLERAGGLPTLKGHA